MEYSNIPPGCQLLPMSPKASTINKFEKEATGFLLSLGLPVLPAV